MAPFTVEEYRSPVPAHFFRTNNPPFRSEIPALHVMLSETEAELGQLNEELSAMQESLTSMRRRRSDMEQTIMLSKSILSSVRLLPREILARILSMAVPEIDHIDLDTSTDIWRFSRVCRIWKDAALSLSSIWTNIKVSFDETSDEFKSSDVSQILRAILAKTSGRPVKLQLNIASDGQRAEQLLEAAMDHSPQWRDVELFLRQKLLMQLRKVKGKIPLLERLQLRSVAKSTNAVAASHIGRAFINAPLLCNLKFVRMHNVRVEGMHLPWHQITHFAISDLPYRKWPLAHPFTQNVLCKMPNLEYFSGWQYLRDVNKEDLVYPNNPANFTPLPSLTLPSLIKLDMICAVNSEITKLLILPALQIIGDTHSHFSLLTHLIRRSHCRIKEISLASAGMAFNDDQSTFTELLHQIGPTLTTLVIQPGFYCNLHSYLVSSGCLEDANILPHLESVHLCAQYLFEERDATKAREIMALLAQRPSLMQPSVSFNHTSRYKIEGHLERYEKLVEEFGMQLKIGPFPYDPPDWCLKSTWAVNRDDEEEEAVST